MKKLFLFTVLLSSIYSGFAQIDMRHKFEFGYLYLLKTTVETGGVTPLSKSSTVSTDNYYHSGFDINISNGVRINERWYAGLGFGYQNFNNIHGVAGYFDGQWIILRDHKISPYLNPRIGYAYLLNYNGSLLLEINFGLRYYLNEKISIYLQTGYNQQHKNIFMPVRLGVVF